MARTGVIRVSVGPQFRKARTHGMRAKDARRERRSVDWLFVAAVLLLVAWGAMMA